MSAGCRRRAKKLGVAETTVSPSAPRVRQDRRQPSGGSGQARRRFSNPLRWRKDAPHPPRAKMMFELHICVRRFRTAPVGWIRRISSELADKFRICRPHLLRPQDAAQCSGTLWSRRIRSGDLPVRCDFSFVAQAGAGLADFLWRNDATLRGLGLEQLSIEAGCASVAMTVLPSMVNGIGITHGGAIFALADAVFSLACKSYNERTVASHCSIASCIRRGWATVWSQRPAKSCELVRSGIYDVRVTRKIPLWRSSARTRA